jgi:hypothetical protein
MIQDIEKLRAKLQAALLSQEFHLRVLVQGDIKVLEARAA